MITAASRDVARLLTKDAEQAIDAVMVIPPKRPGPTSITTRCATQIVCLLIVLPAACADGGTVIARR